MSQDRRREIQRRYYERHKDRLRTEKRARKAEQMKDPEFRRHACEIVKRSYAKHREKNLQADRAYYRMKVATDPAFLEKKRLKQRLYKPSPEVAERAKKRMPEWLRKYRATPQGCAIQMIAVAKANARAASREFRITIDDILPALERRVCQRSGIPFSFPDGKSGTRAFTPSLDRIDNSKGYIPGNVQVVLWMYNRAKGRDRDADVLRMAKALVKQHRIRKKLAAIDCPLFTTQKVCL